MKNYSISAIALATLALGLASCNNDHKVAEQPEFITVSTNIGSLSRVAISNEGTQTFEKDDQISVYAWTGDNANIAAANNTMVVNNSINTYDGTSKWTAAPQMLWKDMTTAHYFLGVYPAKSITDFATDAYTLDATAQEQSDVLVAVNKGIEDAGFKAVAASVPLQFDHVMSKILVRLTFRNQWGGTPTVESVKVNAATTGTINYLAKTVVAGLTKSDITLLTTTANTAYESIMVPQNSETKITIGIGEKDYIYTGDVNLEGGKYTIVNLIVGRDEITLGSVSINDWGVGTPINDGEAQVD